MYKIELNNSRKLADIQDEFQEYFPHLTILFYEVSCTNTAFYPPQLIQDQEAIIQQCRSSDETGYIYLHDELSVSKLKKNIKNNFDLDIEIFHKIDSSHWSQKPLGNKQILKEINFEVY